MQRLQSRLLSAGAMRGDISIFIEYSQYCLIIMLSWNCVILIFYKSTYNLFLFYFSCIERCLPFFPGIEEFPAHINAAKYAGSVAPQGGKVLSGLIELRKYL